MVAEAGRYRTSAAGRAQSSSTMRSSGTHGSTTYTSYASDEGSSLPLPGVSSAPVFGRIRITQSVERDVRHGGLGGVYASGSRGIATTATPSHGRRFSLSTDRILPRDKTLQDVTGGVKLLHQLPYLYERRASLASSTLRSNPIANHHLLAMDDDVTGSLDGIAARSSSYHYPTASVSAPKVSQRGSVPASSVSKYDSHNSAGRQQTEFSRYETYNGRASSVSRYDNQNSFVRSPSLSRYEGQILSDGAPSVSRYENQVPRAPSVSRYDSQSSLGRAPSVSSYESHGSAPRAPSVSRYESHCSAPRAPSVSRYEGHGSAPRAPSVSRYEGPRAPSVSRYESHGSAPRAPSVSRYEGHGSAPRAPSVSRYEGHTSVRRHFRSASVSRYERPTYFSASDETGLHLDYPSGTRAMSVSSSSEHLFEQGAADEDESYELRRQLRAMRNQQIRGGSVARHDRPAEQHVIGLHHEAPVRPRSMSISLHNKDLHHHQRRYKVLTVHSPVKVASPASAPLITGYPEPTLYSAKVFRTHEFVHPTVDGKPDLTGGVDIAASSSEAAFIDNREDITSFVLKPGEKFLPTDIAVSLLPSGKKAVTYTQFSQKGHGDQRTANDEIERIIRKTKLLQDSMHTLEDFVKRNRSLFPEDIIIYQKIVFYLLSEAELIKMGEKPDAEVYGVKIRERLVAPTGTDVASILKRFYSRHEEVDVEYAHPEVIRKQLQQSEMEAAASGKRPSRRVGGTEDEFNLQKPGDFPQSWHPSSRSRSNELHIDEEELLRREGLARSPKRGQRPWAPEFTHRLRGQRAAVGQSVRLSCSVSAFPEPVVTWYRGKQEITDNGRFAVKHNSYSGLCTLTISDLTPEDALLYTVKVVNSEGEATTSGLLEVYDLQENVVPAAQRQAVPPRKRSAEPIAVAAGRRPFFLLEARNLWADVGERAVFEVQAAGKPLPSFTWVKDDSPVTEDGHVQIASDGYGNCKLVIREIRQTDFGTYRCLAQNDDGLIESIASLFCVGNESLRPGQALRDELRSSAGQHRGRKPQFVQVPPSRIDVFEGEPLTLQCAVDGDPKPLITWYKGVRELTYTGRHRVLEERINCYVMQLKSTLATDAGEYTVTAHNLCGLVECIVYVNVLPADRPIEDFDTNWKRPDLTPLDYELVTKTRQGKMPPIFVKKLPREKQMKVGTSLKLDCYVEESKPREYLVDVDIVLRDNKKEGIRPQRTDTKKEGKVRLDALRTQQKTSDFDAPGRSSPKERVSSAQPTVSSIRTEDKAKPSPPLPADHGIVKLADDLAREISSAAVEKLQQQQDNNHITIAKVREHEIQSEGKDEGSDVKIECTEIKSEDASPTEDKLAKTKAEAAPQETKAEDTLTKTKVEARPQETKAEDTATGSKAEVTLTKRKTQEALNDVTETERPERSVQLAESGINGEPAAERGSKSDTGEETEANATEQRSPIKDEKDPEKEEKSSPSDSRPASNETD